MSISQFFTGLYVPRLPVWFIAQSHADGIAGSEVRAVHVIYLFKTFKHTAIRDNKIH